MFWLCLLEQLPSPVSGNNVWVASCPHAGKTGLHEVFPLYPDFCGKDMEIWSPKWFTAHGRVQNFGTTTDLYLLYKFKKPFLPSEDDF